MILPLFLFGWISCKDKVTVIIFLSIIFAFVTFSTSSEFLDTLLPIISPSPLYLNINLGFRIINPIFDFLYIFGSFKTELAILSAVALSLKVDEAVICGLGSVFSLSINSLSVFPTCLSIRCPPFASWAANPPPGARGLLSPCLTLCMPLLSEVTDLLRTLSF